MSFGQRAGGSEIAVLPQDPGEVAQGRPDVGVLGPYTVSAMARARSLNGTVVSVGEAQPC